MAEEKDLNPAMRDEAENFQKYRLAFEQSRDAIMFLDRDSHFYQDCNPATLAMFRIPDVATLATLCPSDLSSPYQPDGRPSPEAAAGYMDEALNQGQAFFEWHQRTWEGDEFPAEVLLNRIDLESGPILQAVVRDISERKRAEEALRAREEELAEGQRIAQMGSWVADFRTNEVRWSDEVYRIFGMSQATWGATFESFMAAVHPNDREGVQAAMEASFQGEPYDVDHRVVRPDGAVRIVRERGFTEFDAFGASMRMVGVVQDITEQRRMEDNLRRLVGILDNTPDMVAMHDGEGTMLYLNAAGRRYMGLPQRTIRDHWRPEAGWDRSDLPSATETLEGTVRWAQPSWAAEKVLDEGLPIAYREGAWQADSALLDGEGSEVPVSQALIVERDEVGNIHQIATIFRDISAHRALEDDLRRQQALSKSVLKGLPGIFYMLDEHGRLVHWNDRMEAVTGHSAKDMDGLEGLALVPDEEREGVAESIEKGFSVGSTLVESKLRTVDGDTPYLFNGLRFELEGQAYLLGMGLDLSKQKQLEAALALEATTDRLTGLYNRQRFDSEMERSLARHTRYGTETALIMVDLDHFKAVNDAYGHDIGDRVLVELGERLAEEMREPDFSARWGGEEFVLLLPETGPNGARQMAERLRRRIEAEPFSNGGMLTISLGVTGFRSGDTANSLLKRVDNALYEAKRAGRNRVVIRGEHPRL